MTDAHPATEQRIIDALIDEMNEKGRVSKLTAIELADELLRMPFTEYDMLIEEAARRIDPTWEDRHGDYEAVNTNG